MSDAHGHPLGPDPRGDVGAKNYCAKCEQRVCTECGRTDRLSGGGSWMSGHCFNCQWVVAERRAEQERRDDARSRLEQRADAWDEGYRSGHSRAMRRMSNEPDVEPGTNPYRAALAEQATT